MAGGEPAGGLSSGEGSRADAVENRSGIVERVRPLPIRGSCRRQHYAARGLAPPRSRPPSISCCGARSAIGCIRCKVRVAPQNGCSVHVPTDQQKRQPSSIPGGILSPKRSPGFINVRPSSKLSERVLISHGIQMTLNQRGQGSSPCVPTNLKSLYNYLPSKCRSGFHSSAL